MNSEIIIIVVQIIAALGVVVSVVYLAVQIHQQNEITKAQFGHSLTQRVYERYFATTKDAAWILPRFRSACNFLTRSLVC